jgi:hypothetical protein
VPLGKLRQYSQSPQQKVLAKSLMFRRKLPLSAPGLLLPLTSLQSLPAPPLPQPLLPPLSVMLALAVVVKAALLLSN